MLRLTVAMGRLFRLGQQLRGRITAACCQHVGCLPECLPESFKQKTQPFCSAFCPDCGQTVSARWAILCCSHCHNKRQANRLALLPVLLPSKPFCSHCGQTETDMIFLPQLQPQQVAFAHWMPIRMQQEAMATEEPVNPFSRAFNTIHVQATASFWATAQASVTQAHVVEGQVLRRVEFIGSPLYTVA